MKKLFPVLLFFSLFIGIKADPITSGEALRIAKSFWGYTPTQARSVNLSFELVYRGIPVTLGKNKKIDAAPFYVYNVGENDGFVIVSGDDDLTPVVGYADGGSFDTGQMPDGMRAWLDTYSGYVLEVWTGRSTAVKNSAVVRKGEIVVAPMLTAQWGQGVPFNNMTPLYGSTHMVSGCGSVAIGQVMKYYNWPDRGVGSNSYDCEGVGTLSVDFSQSVYDWGNILDIYEEGEYSDIQGNAVAKLIYDAGVALNMKYGPDGSGSTTPSILTAMSSYFKYKRSIQLRYRENTVTEDWMRIIRNELNEARPFLYRGTSPSGGGHIFVCDGMDSNDYLHINWGWNGHCDGFFNMNYMDPYNPSAGGGSEQYNDGQAIIFGIEPLKPGDSDAVAPVSLFLRSNTEVSVKQINRKMAFYVTANGVWNRSETDYAGSVGLALYQNGEIKIVLATVPYTMKPNYYANSVRFGSSVIPTSYPEGDYELRIVSKASTESEWTPTLFNLDVAGDIQVNISNGIITFSQPEVKTLDIELTRSVTEETVLYSQRTGILGVSLQNNSVTHYTGALYLELIREGESAVAARFTDGVVLFGGTEMNLDLEHTMQVVAGTYTVKVYYEDPVNGQVQIRGAESQITVQQTPSVPVLQMFDKLNTTTGSEDFNRHDWVYISEACKNAGTSYTGTLYLYARSTNGALEEEYQIGRCSGFSVAAQSPGRNWFYISGSLQNLSLGSYEVYVKYDRNGSLVRMEPYNRNSMTITVGDLSGITKDSVSGEIFLSPNPAKDKLVVKSLETLQKVSILSLSGSLIKEYPCEGFSEVSVSVGELPAGNYILRAITVKGVWNRAFIKQ